MLVITKWSASSFKLALVSPCTFLALLVCCDCQVTPEPLTPEPEKECPLLQSTWIAIGIVSGGFVVKVAYVVISRLTQPPSIAKPPEVTNVTKLNEDTTTSVTDDTTTEGTEKDDDSSSKEEDSQV